MPKPLLPRSEPTDAIGKGEDKRYRAVRVRCCHGPRRGVWVRVQVEDTETLYWFGKDDFSLVERDDAWKTWRASHVELNGLGLLFRNVGNK